MTAPEYVIKAMNSASGLCKCYINNAKANEWLCTNLGLVLDDNTHSVSGFDVDFCWKNQKWFVK